MHFRKIQSQRYAAEVEQFLGWRHLSELGLSEESTDQDILDRVTFWTEFAVECRVHRGSTHSFGYDDVLSYLRMRVILLRDLAEALDAGCCEADDVRSDIGKMAVRMVGWP